MAIDVPRLFRQALSGARFDDRFLLQLSEAARHAAAALLAEMDTLPAQWSLPGGAYPAWRLARYVEHTLATTHGIAPASAALRLALRPARPPRVEHGPLVFDEHVRERWILARIAIRQPPDVAIELLERFEERAEAATLLPDLTQELITRNRVRPADHAVVARLLREMRGRESPFAWLPENPLPIEKEVVFPMIGEMVFESPPELPPIDEPEETPARWPWGSQTLIELEPPVRGVAWPRAGTQVELRAFQLPPLSAGIGAASAVASVPLDAIAPAPLAMRSRAHTASEAFAFLFRAASVDEGWPTSFAAWPRLVGWKLLAALSGAAPGDSPEAIENAAQGLEWTRIAAHGGWFGQVDLGWAFILAARDISTRRLRVLAVSRVEPRT